MRRRGEDSWYGLDFANALIAAFKELIPWQVLEMSLQSVRTCAPAPRGWLRTLGGEGGWLPKPGAGEGRQRHFELLGILTSTGSLPSPNLRSVQQTPNWKSLPPGSRG